MEHHTSIKQWKRDELQFCRFPTYDLIYAHYYRYKFPSWGLKNETLIAEGVVRKCSSNNNNNIKSRFSDQLLNFPTSFNSKLSKVISFQSFVSLFSMICFTTRNDDQATMTNNNNNNYADNDDDGIIDDEDKKYNRKYFRTKFISVPHFGPIRKSLNTFVVQHRFFLTACVKLISFSIILFSLWTDKISWNWSKNLLQKSRALSNRHEFVHEFYCIFWWHLPTLFVDFTSHSWLVFAMTLFVLIFLFLLPLHICSKLNFKSTFVLKRTQR